MDMCRFKILRESKPWHYILQKKVWWHTRTWRNISLIFELWVYIYMCVCVCVCVCVNLTLKLLSCVSLNGDHTRKFHTICLKTIGIGLLQLTLYVLTKLNGIQLIGSSFNLVCHKKYQGPHETCNNFIGWTDGSRRGTNQMVIAFRTSANIGTTDSVILYHAWGQDHSPQLMPILSGWQPHATHV